MSADPAGVQPGEIHSTAAHPPKNLDALRAAQLYYLQDQTMESIARELRTSRASVSPQRSPRDRRAWSKFT
jgi:hypothetical protein